MPRSSLVRICLLALLAALLPATSLAQQTGAPSQEEMERMQREMMQRYGDPATMQKMAEEAEAMQACMEGIDEADLMRLQREAEKIKAEIDRLCAAGKESEAQRKAIAMSQKLDADPTVQKMRECTAGMSEMMKGMPMMQLPDFDVDEEPGEDGRGICDG